MLKKVENIMIAEKKQSFQIMFTVKAKAFITIRARHEEKIAIKTSGKWKLAAFQAFSIGAI